MTYILTDKYRQNVREVFESYDAVCGYIIQKSIQNIYLYIKAKYQIDAVRDPSPEISDRIFYIASSTCLENRHVISDSEGKEVTGDFIKTLQYIPRTYRVGMVNYDDNPGNSFSWETIHFMEDSETYINHLRSHIEKATWVATPHSVTIETVDNEYESIFYLNIIPKPFMENLKRIFINNYPKSVIK